MTVLELFFITKTRQGRQGKKLKISQRVIVNPNVIMRPPVEFVVTAFGAKGNEQAQAMRIRFTGEIRHSLMKRACEKDWPSDDKELIPTDEIVELLESRYILHEDAKSAGGENVYFLPCLLSSDNNVFPQSRNCSHLNSLIYPPILLIPNEGHIPPGLFSATIVKLSRHWKLVETEIPIQKVDAKQTRFRNRIRFFFKGELDVELRALPTHLEFRILHDASEHINPRLILECRSELRKYFKKVLASFPLTKNWKWDFGFYCPHALHSDKIPPHPARCSAKDKPEKVICSQPDCKSGLVGLEDKHKCWFTEITLEQLVHSTVRSESASLDQLEDEVPLKKKRWEADFKDGSPLACTSRMKRKKHEQSALPTLLDLTQMKGADDLPLRMIQTIAAHDYTTFGICLLQDENGEEVDLIEKDYINKGAKSVTRAILKKWLESGAPTRTYQHLIECLRQSELGALAELIETQVCEDTISPKKHRQ